MRKKEVMSIIKEVSSLLKKSKYLDVMFCSGSVAAGRFDQYIDIDLMVWTNKIINYKYILKLLDKLDYKLYYTNDSFPLHLDIIINGRKVTLFFIKSIWWKPTLKNYKKLHKMQLKEQADLIRIKNSILLFDKINLIKKYKKLIPEYPKGMREFILYNRIHWLNHQFFLKNGAVNIERKRGNILEVSIILNESLTDIYKILFALNNKFMTDRKWAYTEIPKFKKKPKNCLKRLVQISRLGNSKKEINKKIEMIRKLAKELKPLIAKEGVKNLPELKITSEKL